MKGKVIGWILVILVFVSNCTLYAQTVSKGFGESGIFQNDMRKTTKGQIALLYSNIGGSPYSSEEFARSDIYFDDGNIKRNVRVRLNLYDNNLEFELQYEYYILSKINQVEKIVFENQEVVFIGEDDAANLKGFYKVQVAGDNQLLSSLKVEFKEAVAATNSYNEGTEATFKKEKEKFYLQTEQGDLLSFKNKKEFFDVFSKENQQLASYAKKEKINPRKYNDLVKIVNYLNSNP